MRTHEQILKSLVRENITVLLRPSLESKILRVDVEHFCRAIQTLVRKTQETIPGGGTIVVETRIADLPQGDGVSLPAGAYCAIIISNSGPVRNESRRNPHIRTVLHNRRIRDRRSGPRGRLRHCPTERWTDRNEGRSRARHHVRSDGSATDFPCMTETLYPVVPKKRLAGRRRHGCSSSHGGVHAGGQSICRNRLEPTTRSIGSKT